MIDNSDGRRWARVFLGLALFVSMVGNVTHTVLADSSISLWLRVPGAILWPLFTFGGIEIIVRMIWERRWTHSFARNMVLFPALPAAIISYEHLYSLLLLMGERQFIAFIGPLAIDGMMVGCTMALLFTRKAAEQAPRIVPMSEIREDAEAVQDAAYSLSALLPQPTQDWSTAELDNPHPSAPVSPAPVREWNAREVAEMAVDGKKAREIHEALGVSMAQAGRFTKVAKALRANPRADIDPAREKLHADHVKMLRELVSR